MRTMTRKYIHFKLFSLEFAPTFKLKNKTKNQQLPKQNKHFNVV